MEKIDIYSDQLEQMTQEALKLGDDILIKIFGRIPPLKTEEKKDE